MTIKTKKITDLGKITIDEKNIKLTDGDFYVIGCKAGVTGKVATNEIVNSIKLLVDDKSSDIETIKESISSLSSSIATIASDDSKKCDCEEKIEALEAKVAALECFVKALQEEGYLTLAKIKQAAVEACPICTHTHEEEQSAE